MWSPLALLVLWVHGCTSTDDNSPPVANAGADQVIEVTPSAAEEGVSSLELPEIALDGSASLDPDGDYLTRFFWTFDTVPPGSAITRDSFTINREDLSYTRFTPDVPGIYGVTLEVFDGQKLSLADYVQVDVRVVNSAPVAIAGPDLNGAVGETSVFDGDATFDPDGDFLSYLWTLEVLPPESTLPASAVLQAATANARLVPDVSGVYVLSLLAFDGQTWSLPDFVTLTVASGNQPPVPVLTPSGTVTPCWVDPITLDASQSTDPEGDSLTYRWHVAQVPYGSLVRETSLTTPDAATTQVALDLVGLYVFEVTLWDGYSVPVTGVVTLLNDSGVSQEPPEADPGGNRTVIGQSTCAPSGCAPCALGVTLDGSYSYDPNLDPLTFAWRVVQGEGTLRAPTAAQTWLDGPALIPPGAGRVSTASVLVELVVSDCFVASEPVEVSIFFSCEGL